MLRTEEIRYYINEEKRTIVAVVEDFNVDAYEQLGRVSDLLDIALSTVASIVIPVNKISAKAKCHPEDAWDEAKGMEIARKKLLKRYNKLKYQAIKKSLDIIERELNVGRSIQESVRKRFE